MGTHQEACGPSKKARTSQGGKEALDALVVGNFEYRWPKSGYARVCVSPWQSVLQVIECDVDCCLSSTRFKLKYSLYHPCSATDSSSYVTVAYNSWRELRVGGLTCSPFNPQMRSGSTISRRGEGDLKRDTKAQWRQTDLEDASCNKGIWVFDICPRQYWGLEMRSQYTSSSRN